MAKNIHIQIPVRKHLFKYATQKFPPRLTRNDQMGIIVFSMLKNCKFNAESAGSFKEFPCLWQIEVGEFMLERKYIAPHLTKEFVNQLDTILDKEFKKDLYVHVSMLAQKGVERKIAIEKFCEVYNIHEKDISFEALKKAEYRFRKEQPLLLVQ